jgi:hypothetical protein
MDTADQMLPTEAATLDYRLPLAQAEPLQLAPAKPEINRQERVNFTAYLVMIGLVVVFLAVTGLVAWLGA